MTVMMSEFEGVIRKFSLMMALTPDSNHEWKGNEIPIRVIERMTRYFRAEQRAGRVRKTDPEVLARVTLGSIHQFTFAELHGFNRFFEMTREAFIEGVVDLITNGSEDVQQTFNQDETP